MKKLLPYSLPLLLSLLFVALARTDWLWVSPLLIFLIGPLTTYAGEFTTEELMAEYAFFHHTTLMTSFKTLNGLFFVGLNVWAFYLLATASFPLWHWGLLVYGMVILNSNFALSLAHDLMHSSHQMDRWLSTFLLLQNGFFYLEPDHLYIHHPHVGTANDPATARRGESIWPYLIRSLRGRMRLLFGQEGALPSKRSRQIARLTALRLMVCLSYLLVGALVNAQVFGWLLAQYVFVILIYESITYIQHYGMQRNQQAGGYESIGLQHAWNSFYKLNAYLYFMMPVHSLHHVHQPDLSGQFAGPRMPLSFAKMLITAWQPKRWFALMNQRLNSPVAQTPH